MCRGTLSVLRTLSAYSSQAAVGGAGAETPHLRSHLSSPHPGAHPYKLYKCLSINNTFISITLTTHLRLGMLEELPPFLKTEVTPPRGSRVSPTVQVRRWRLRAGGGSQLLQASQRLR